MKIGTLSCTLFGHKFVGVFISYKDGVRRETKKAIGGCVRCGIDKPVK